MTNTKKIWYLLAALLIIVATALALIGSRRSNTEVISGEPYQPIAGAKTSSYEPVGESLTLTADDNVIGSETAPLTIFVYEDYASPYSAELADTLKRIISESSDKLAVVIRPFVTAGNNISREGALAVMCAKDSGKFTEMRDSILADTKEGKLLAGGFSAYATQLGLAENTFNTCLTNEEKSVKLEAVMTDADKNLVLGAPTIFVGNEMIIGARPYNDFVDSNGDAIEGLRAVIDRQSSQLPAETK
ncbi:MAG TPA: thioredoxin domain-containing protein [Candidatus Saccharimonadales bacterium]|nr:thioredoxin domain-containing protein [Candidatus Saccharimonadales bacterium]